jgi:hypothetical protein
MDTTTMKQTTLSKMTAKAIQSEELAADHYRSLALIARSDLAAKRFLGDANEEARHAIALRNAAARDALVLPATQGWREDLATVHSAFEASLSREDLAACLFIQDVFLECVSITLYETIARVAADASALTLCALIEKRIIPDERLHLASGLREIARTLPNVADRIEAFRRASVAMLPALLTYADSAPEASCSSVCGSCQDRCLKLDATASNVTFRGDWDRIVAQIDEATRKVGIRHLQGSQP